MAVAGIATTPSMLTAATIIADVDQSKPSPDRTVTYDHTVTTAQIDLSVQKEAASALEFWFDLSGPAVITGYTSSPVSGLAVLWAGNRLRVTASDLSGFTPAFAPLVEVSVDFTGSGVIDAEITGTGSGDPFFTLPSEINVQPKPNAVPEPSYAGLLGLIGLCAYGRRRR